MKKLLTLVSTAILGSCLLLGPMRSLTEATVVDQYFHARVRLALCPEFRAGNVSLQIKYRIGNSTTAQPANVISQSINSSQNTGRFDILLPTSYAATPLQVFAQCVNSRGTSAPSNIKTISNCDALGILDTDLDGIANNAEDRNCNNRFDGADSSNPDHFDSDGDGMRDYYESLAGTDRLNAGSSPRPFVFSGEPFDPDGDGDANPVVFRISKATWYVRDFVNVGYHLSFPFGRPGDVPITYRPAGATSDVGVVRNVNGVLYWFLRGRGFLPQTGVRQTVIPFGVFHDIPIPGPWETPGVTNPALMRLKDERWYFYVYLSNGTIRQRVFGVNNDVPKIQDYDGDGLLDIALFRSSNKRIYVIRSSDREVRYYNFGTASADYTFRGDVSGDGVDDITFWEPQGGVFTSMISDRGFDEVLAQEKNVNYFYRLQLGQYFVHLPLSYNRRNGKDLYTIINHQNGVRYFRPNNDKTRGVQSLQWGLPGDAQG